MDNYISLYHTEISSKAQMGILYRQGMPTINLMSLIVALNLNQWLICVLLLCSSHSASAANNKNGLK